MVWSTAMAVQAQTVFSPRGAVWKYHNLGLAPGGDWKAPGYDDSGWLSGNGPLGGGDAHIVTAIDIGPAGSRYPTVYFRREFSVAAAGDYEGFVVRLLRDDGAAVYLNGTLLVSEGVDVPTLHDQYANQVVDGANESTYFVHTAPTSALVTGRNVLAVEVKQTNPGSSDLGFDLELEGIIDETPPAVLEVEPLRGLTVASLEFIRVVFDEGITGIDAEDLLVQGVPATGMTFLSNREYEFTFPSVATGLVQVAWAPGHGITDDSPRANPFAGGEWSYTVDPEAVDRPNVILSEFLASNGSGIRDEDGSRSDWIELLNLGPAEASLEGWFLTDDANDLTQWRFPDVRLGVGETLLVWASGKDRRVPTAPLHANFSLSAGGEYLALLNARTQVVSEFAPVYPPQQTDISYGRDRVEPTLLGYFLEPTPGAPNATSGAGFAEPPEFSLESGVYAVNSLTLTLSAAPGTTLRQTVDGSVPTDRSPLVTGPITFSTSLMLKVRAFPADPSLLPSPVVSRTFVLLDPSTRTFQSKLPMMVITTPGREIPQNVPPGQPRQPGTLLVVDTYQGRSGLQLDPDFHGWAEFEIFGQTSTGFPKQPHRIEIQDELRSELGVPLLGMPADGDWRLRNPYSDKCLINDFLAQELFEATGRYAVRRRLVEVFVNTTGGRLTYPRDYYGVMVLLENIERGSDRVDIARLGPEHLQEPEISGGYMWKKDKDSQGDVNFFTSGGGSFGGQALKIHEPRPRDILPEQVQWLQSYLNRMEQAMYASNWRTATGTNHYSHYLDVDSFVDHHWIVEFTKQIDGYRLSNYMQKDRGGKVRMEPIWDWNLSFGNADYLDGGRTNGWYYTQLDENAHIWLRRLISGTTSSQGTAGDPEFHQRIADRWSVLRTNAFNGDRVVARIDELAALLDEAADRDFERFPRLGWYIWPNPNGPAGGWHVDYVTPTTYAGIIREMKRWVSGRYRWIDSQFAVPPVMNHPGGEVPPGFNLVMTSVPGATIYYTLDGSDPRAPGGGISSQAIIYGGPQTITDNVRVRARARRAGTWQNTWSGPVERVLYTALPSLRITEIMYHPEPPLAGSPYGAQDFEFIEVRNIGATPLDVGGFRFINGITLELSQLVLGAGQRAVVVANRGAFESRHGTGIPIAGEYQGRLNNAGERLELIGPSGEPIHDFAYDPRWHPITDGFGFSLVTVDDSAPLEQWGSAAGWRPSGRIAGSPGQEDPLPPVFPRVVINEVLTRPGSLLQDAIELKVQSELPVDLGGWFLTDNFRSPRKYTIPTGTVVPAGGYLLVRQEAFDDNNPGDSFALSAQGEEVFVFSGNAAGELTGYVQGFAFGAAAEEVSFGRHVLSTGEERMAPQAAVSLGERNQGPRSPSVVISEVHYHPSPIPANGQMWNNTEDEYIEVLNPGPAPVSLRGWRLQDGVTFDFPDDTILPAGGMAVVVSFDPAADSERAAAFRVRFQVPISVPLLGSWDGTLNNAGETVSLVWTESVLPVPDPALAVWIVEDQVTYGGSLPWPPGADGGGEALHRWETAGYGEDALHWSGAAPGPGHGPWVDTDGDGMPDLWETRYQLDAGNSADALVDADLDGMGNGDEYRAGTDPTDAGQRLAFESARVTDGVRFQFTGQARRAYAVEYRDRLAPGDWVPLGQVPALSEDRMETVIDPNPGSERYYRVVLEDGPEGGGGGR
jgi:hypothetical protein